MNWYLEWNKKVAPLVVEIVKERKNELPKLLRNEKVVLKELMYNRIVAAFGEGTVKGFVYFRRKKNETITLYEIAKRKKFEGRSVCRVLVDWLKKEGKVIRLKCSIRNEKGLQFWDRMGFEKLTIESRWNDEKGRFSTYYIMEWKPNV